MKLSYQELKTYKICPLQYRWAVLGGYPKEIDKNQRNKVTFIGHLFQGIVEKFYREEWWKKPVEVLANFRMAIPTIAQKISNRSAIRWQDMAEYNHWLQVAQDAVPLIIKTIKAERLIDKTRNLTELPITVPLNGNEILGRTDYVIGTTLLDGKGGGTYGRYVDKDQLVTYDLGVQERLKIKPEKIGFWWFRFAKIQWYKITDDIREKYKQEALVAINGIGNLKFDPVPGPHCRLCDFRLGCDEGMKYSASTAHQLPDVDVPNNLSSISL